MRSNRRMVVSWLLAALAGVGVPANAGSAGTVEGKVVLIGEAPPPRKVNLKVHPDRGGMFPKGLSIQDYVADAHGGLRDVLVYIKGNFVSEFGQVPKETAVLKHENGLIHPPVLAVRMGESVEFDNVDNCGFFIMPEVNRKLSLAAPKHTVIWNEPEPGPFRVRCDLHPWNQAYIGVFSHPYFTTTGPDGSFKFTGVPPGRYTLEIFHRRARAMSKEIDVAEGGTVSVQFEVQPK